jgi:hypothetical protein
VEVAVNVVAVVVAAALEARRRRRRTRGQARGPTTRGAAEPSPCDYLAPEDSPRRQGGRPGATPSSSERERWAAQGCPRLAAAEEREPCWVYSVFCIHGRAPGSTIDQDGRTLSAAASCTKDVQAARPLTRSCLSCEALSTLDLSGEHTTSNQQRQHLLHHIVNALRFG